MNPRRATALAAAGIAALTLAIYAQVIGFDFVGLDDPRYVTENPAVLAGVTRDGAEWAFTTFHKSNWHPLTWLSHMLDVALFGADPAGHHATSVLLHLLNALVLLALLLRLTGAPWPSAWVAALFAVHPLHVESVAWVSERKDVLCTLFGLLAIGAYAEYARGRRIALLAVSLLLFAVSLAAKPMFVTLPFLLLLLDYWPLERLRADRTLAVRLAEKLPFAALALASSAVTLAADHHGRATDWLQLDLPARIANALVSYATYLVRAVWPADLAAFYPHAGVAAGTAAGAAVLLFAITALVAWSRRRYAIVGWLWYLGTLVPVSGVVAQVGLQGMADRYTYVPLIGIFIAIAWGADEIVQRLRAAWATLTVVAAGLACVVALAWLAWHQAGTWRDSKTLYEHALAVAPSSPIHNNLGGILDREGRREEAIHHYREALRIDPENFLARRNLARALRDQGQFAEAAEQLLRATNIDPESAMGQLAKGLAARAQGDLDAAIAHLERAAELDPASQDARRELRSALDARAGANPR
jgi:tetratricopeptide (TPR) repeat protein